MPILKMTILVNFKIFCNDFAISSTLVPYFVHRFVLDFYNVKGKVVTLPVLLQLNLSRHSCKRDLQRTIFTYVLTHKLFTVLQIQRYLAFQVYLFECIDQSSTVQPWKGIVSLYAAYLLVEIDMPSRQKQVKGPDEDVDGVIHQCSTYLQPATNRQ